MNMIHYILIKRGKGFLVITHKIQDNSNEYVMDLLADGLIESDDVNYNPLYENLSQNLFKKIRSGLFKNSSYIVLEDENGYVGSSGWYEYNEDIALVLVRSYVKKEYRQRWILSKYCLPIIMEQTKKYKKLWITVNESNSYLNKSFERIKEGKLAWPYTPQILRKFEPIGKKYINGMDQYIIEYLR